MTDVSRMDTEQLRQEIERLRDKHRDRSESKRLRACVQRLNYVLGVLESTDA